MANFHLVCDGVDEPLIASRGDGLLAETVMNWMSEPTRFLKPPLIGGNYP